ncbi:hypothetical protein ANANG_G00298030 [Anguilla anguilla]|uniref:DNA topoisomerase n=1 Tax=Anguilla anguilla TaxID=7936 RepID=A0A9D3RHY6_ANGAN|nr:hypothetical protein ANANG_G00298030 [Anguilla anguilla]
MRLPEGEKEAKNALLEAEKNEQKQKEDTDCLLSLKKKPEQDSKPMRPIVKEEEGNQQWWEEQRNEDGTKWKFLEPKGPLFPAECQPLPDGVSFYYNGRAVKLNPHAEEVAFFYAQMLDHEYTTKEVFRNNFLTDWRKEMTPEFMLITDLDKCDFWELFNLHKRRVEAQHNMCKEEKQAIKAANARLTEEYGYCTLDQHRERIGNFRIEPPGLFRGRGDHPKQGMLKRRIQPEDVIINCSKQSEIPEPPAGHRWKEVCHDNNVTWLASWTENIEGSYKYIMLNASSKLKGEKNWEKYEVARRLSSYVDQIRSQYYQDMDSKEMLIRQRATALYLIDKGGEREGGGETADTVGCCSLHVEHLILHRHLGEEEYVVEFDFLGKDSIRYCNRVPVIKRVYKNLKVFMEDKQAGDDLFDRLSLMPGLTAKVFRTYNASITLQKRLAELSCKSDGQALKLLAYNRANRAVAVLCNHQRAEPKSFEQSMASLRAKIKIKTQELVQAKTELKLAKWKAKGCPGNKLHVEVEKKRKTSRRLEDQLLNFNIQATDREEGKQIALGTSKLSYLDPRITLAWCKNMKVPVDRIYNKSQREKFAWAIDMAEADFKF